MNYNTLDKGFYPIEQAIREYEKSAKDGIPFAICVERSDTERYTYRTTIVNPTSRETVKYAERLTRTILYAVGGYRVLYGGSDETAKLLAEIFCLGGKRAFDVTFMARVYGHPFEVKSVAYDVIQPSADKPSFAGGKNTGARIGFDAGGSDRKVAAVLDGKVVYSEEVIWHPKTTADTSYHYAEILTAFKTAASYLPRVDSIGVSTAGIVIDNQLKIASLFIKVSDEDWDKHVKNIYIDVARELGENIPITVANDGDVTALSGALTFGENGILGIAMGTSQAAGFISPEGAVLGWLNELAFVPVDYNENAMVDEWCGDYGCGVKYFSQDGVIKLAEMASIPLQGTPAEKLKAVQEMLSAGDERVTAIFETIGVYLAHSLALYKRFYDFDKLLLLGRVMSGRGGNIILDTAKSVIAQQYPEYANVRLLTPDEKMRRLGQAVAASEL